MAHKVVNDQVLVDQTTGDPEGDRAVLFRAYRGFIKEIRQYCTKVYSTTDSDDKAEVANEVLKLFSRWSIMELNVDEFPRINVAFPDGYEDKLKKGREDGQT